MGRLGCQSPAMLFSLVTQSPEAWSVLAGITLEIGSIIPSMLRWCFSLRSLMGCTFVPYTQLSSDGCQRKKQADFVLEMLQLLLFCSPAVPEQLAGSSRGEALQGFPFGALLSIRESNPHSPCSLAAEIGNCTFPGPQQGSLLSFPEPPVLQTCQRADNPLQLRDSPFHQLTRHQKC